MKPFIGIPAYTHTYSETGRPYYRGYVPIVHAVEQAGGIPFLIPYDLEDTNLRALYRRIDGLLLPGGGDIHPRFFGDEAPHPSTNIEEARDEAEIKLIRWAADDDMPMLGICRGCQIMNVALGGTLIQDIPSQIATDIAHDFPNSRPRGLTAHPVTIVAESRLAQIVGEAQIMVNSWHHQVIDKLAPGAVLAAQSPDELVEAFEIPSKRFVISVQWHPEDMIADDEASRKLFRAFIRAAQS